MIGTILGAALVAGFGCAKKQEAAPEPVAPAPVVEAAPALVAAATLMAQEGGTLAGEVTFTEANGAVAIVAHITGAPPGTHGFHIHEVGDCSSADFKSAGGHFNPTDMPHGAPTDMERHAGDLGNVEVLEDGTAHHEATSSMITVAAGPSSIVGRGVILHEKADDLVSQPTGAAGGRIACGVVELSGWSARAARPCCCSPRSRRGPRRRFAPDEAPPRGRSSTRLPRRAHWRPTWRGSAMRSS